MKKFQECILLTSFVVGIFFISGCSGSLPNNAGSIPAVHLSPPVDETGRDRALQHFINGAALDAKEAYAEAILEYQEALKTDSAAAIYYVLSKDYSLLNTPLQAKEAGKKAVQLDSMNKTYRENLASIYVNAYQQDMAIEQYEKIVRIESSSMDSWYTLARLYQTTKPLRALEIYEKILEHDGDQPDILYQCGVLYTTLGRFDQAAEKFKRMLTLNPDSKQLQKQLADVYTKAGRLSEAKKILQSMLDADQNDPEIIAALADIHMDQKEYTEAIKLYQKLLAQGVTNPEVKLRIGIGMFGLIEHDSTMAPKAQNIFEEMSTVLIGDWRPHWYLGILALNAKKDSLAAYQFKIVTTLAEWNANAWWFLGSTLFSRNKFQEVLEAMQKAEKSVPKDFRIYLLQGLVYSRLAQPDKTIERLEIAHRLNPKDINTLSTLALTYDNEHRYEMSDSLYEEALRVDPQSALLLNNYGYSLSERGLQLNRALEMSLIAITSEPENSAYLDTYGWICYRLGQYQQARQYIEKAVAAGSASAVIYEHLGDVYFRMGDQKKAVTTWQKALEMDSKNETLRKKIERGSL
ncbi:MAG: tetratricopeptide repeat protein [Bacteroidota bacterium]